jgi:hypothetical protein
MGCSSTSEHAEAIFFTLSVTIPFFAVADTLMCSLDVATPIFAIIYTLMYALVGRRLLASDVRARWQPFARRSDVHTYCMLF